MCNLLRGSQTDSEIQPEGVAKLSGQRLTTEPDGRSAGGVAGKTHRKAVSSAL
jgi:hypothetical protein